jgi:hypothetical protein
VNIEAPPWFLALTALGSRDPNVLSGWTNLFGRETRLCHRGLMSMPPIQGHGTPPRVALDRIPDIGAFVCCGVPENAAMVTVS